MHDLLVTDALIVTCDDRMRVVHGGALAVDGGLVAGILEAGDGNAAKARETVSARGRIVMPGLVNMHCHAGDSLYRGLVEGMPLEAWLDRLWVAQRATMTPEANHLGSLLGLAENLLGGATTVADMYWFPAETAKAAAELGMRLSTGGIFFDPPGVGGRGHAEYLSEAEGFFREHSGSDTVIPAAMPHGTYTVSPERLVDAKRLADGYGALFHTHAAETRAERADIEGRYGLSVIRHMDRHGLLGRSTLLAHCVHVDDEEIDLIAGSGSVVVHNPLSNLKLGSGVAPVRRMLESGVRLALGTDGAVSGNDLDMWLAMRLAATLPKGFSMRADAVSPAEVLRMATLGGAEALGKGSELGSLEAGKRADFLLLDVTAVHAAPMFDPVSHLVYCAGRADVRDVYVGGRLVVADGSLAAMDIGPVLERVREMAPRIRASLDGGE